MSEHVGDLDIARFRAGKLDRPRVEAIGAHVRDCAKCASRVWSSNEVRTATDAVVNEMRQARAPVPTRLSKLAVAAALLAVLGALMMFVVRSSKSPEAPAPIAVKPPAPLPVTHPWDALVADALQRGDIAPPPSLRELRRGAGEVVRGPVDGGHEVRLVAPVGTSVETQTPEFRWTPAGGAAEVMVARDGNVVAKSGRISGTSWTPSRPLPRDARYEWQITIGSVHIPPPEAPPARFRVIGGEEAKMLAAARASGDPVAIGVVAAKAGLVDEAVAKLSAASDPRANALAEKIRKW